jgi:hypothetical protein
VAAPASDFNIAVALLLVCLILTSDSVDPCSRPDDRAADFDAANLAEVPSSVSRRTFSRPSVGSVLFPAVLWTVGRESGRRVAVAMGIFDFGALAVLSFTLDGRPLQKRGGGGAW